MPPARAARARVDRPRVCGFSGATSAPDARPSLRDAMRCAAHGGTRRPSERWADCELQRCAIAAGDDEVCVCARACARMHRTRQLPLCSAVNAGVAAGPSAAAAGVTTAAIITCAASSTAALQRRTSASFSMPRAAAKDGARVRVRPSRRSRSSTPKPRGDAACRRAHSRARGAAARVGKGMRRRRWGGLGLGALRADALHADERRLVHVHERRQQPEQTRAAAAEPTRRTEVSTPV